MKKLTMILLLILLILPTSYSHATSEFLIYYENDLITYTDQQPVIVNSRTLVPVRTVESLGFEVDWDSEERSVLVAKGSTQRKFYIDQHYVYSDEMIFVMDVNAQIMNNRTMIPLRFLVEGFDMTVTYERVNNQHVIRIMNQSSYGFDKGIVLGPNGDVDGVFNDQIFRSIEVDPEDDNIVVVGTEANGMFKSIDGGATWNWYREGLLTNKQPEDEYPEFYDISIAADKTTYYAAFASSPGPAEGNYPSAFSGVYVSEDAGKTWIRRVSGLSSGTVSAMVAHPTDPNIAYTGVRGGMPSFTMGGFEPSYYLGGVYKTIDAGQNWVKMTPEGLPDTSDYYRIKTYKEDTVMAMAMRFYNHDEAAGLLLSKDSGASWQAINPQGIYFGDFDNYDDQIIYAISDDKGSPLGIYKTINGGQNWTKTSAMGYGAIRVSPHDSNLVAYSQRDKLYMSYNGLASSKHIMTYDSTVPNAIITDIVFSKNNPNVIYAGGPGLRIYKSVDQGKNFDLMINLREVIESYRVMDEGLKQSLIDNPISD